MPFPARCCVLFLLACATAVHADEAWTARIADGRQRTLENSHFAGSFDDGSFAIDAWYHVTLERWRLLYGPDGRLLDRTPGFGEPLRSHGAVATRHTAPSLFARPDWRPERCEFRRNALGGRDERVLHPGIPFVPTPWFDGDGGMAVHFEGEGGATQAFVARIAPDCRLGARYAMPVQPGSWLWNDPASAASYALRQDADARSLLRLVDGREAWTRRIARSEWWDPTVAHVSADGQVLLKLGTRTYEMLAPDGRSLWRRGLHPDREHSVEFHSEPDALYMNFNDREAASEDWRFARLAGDGRVQWEVAGRYKPMHRNRPSERAVFLQYDGATPRGVALFANAGGFEVAGRAPAGIELATRLPNGAYVGREHQKTGFLPADGGPYQPITPQVPMRVQLQALAKDQAGTVVASQRDGEGVEVSEYGTGGVLRWRTRLPARDRMDDIRNPYGVTSLVLDDSRACVLHRDTSEAWLSCLSRGDGAASPWVAAGGTSIHGMTAVGLTPAGVDLVRKVCNPCRTERVTVSPDGHVSTPVWMSNSLDAEVAAISRGGHVALADTRTRQSLEIVARDGTRLVQRQFDRPIAVRALDDAGQALVAGNGVLFLVGADGATRWTLPGLDDAFSRGSAVALSNGDWLLSLPATESSPVTIAKRLRGSDGATVWSSSATDAVSTQVAFTWHLSGDGRTAFRLANGVAKPGWPAGQRVRAIDVDTGALRWSHAVPEATDERNTQGVQVALDGAGNLVRAYEHAPSGELVLAQTPAAHGAVQGIDPAALGAWRIADAAGQGLFFDADGTGAAFGAWFTYGLPAHHQPSGLAWYTLAARTETTAGSRFTVFRSRDGVFAAGPAAPSDAVGEATLRLLGCDRAMLHYRMRVDGRDLENVVPLERAARANRECIGGSGRDARAAQGLDPRSSGAWYDPSTPGQGVAFDLAPPQDGQGGFLAGAWFTFDPAGASDDAASQHWFTLAGPIDPGAAAGSVSVPIHRTLGGGFDHRPTHHSVPVGKATLSFATCDRATLAYAFDNTHAAAAFAGLAGQRELLRVGGCGD